MVIPNCSEIWISTNTYPANTRNLGTLSDPYDGSDPMKFAPLLCLAPNITVHLLAGTYQTFGSASEGYFLKTGQKILGSGIDTTIIQLTPGLVVGGSGASVLMSDFAYARSNIEVCDLTCDCNYTPGTMETYHGVLLAGTQNAVRRVKLIHQAKYGGSSESFGIVLWNPSLPDSTGNIIEECEVSQFEGGNFITAIGFSGGANGGTSGILRNNRVLLPPANNTGMLAFNNGWTHDVLIEGNYVNGGDVACYGDTGSTTNMIVAHNMFINCGSGIFFDNGTRNNMTFAFNIISSTTTLANPAAFTFNNQNGAKYADLVGSYSNIVIIGNTVNFSGTAGSFVKASNLHGLEVADNSVDESLFKNNSFSTDCTGINMYRNFDLTGNFLTYVNQVDFAQWHHQNNRYLYQQQYYDLQRKLCR